MITKNAAKNTKNAAKTTRKGKAAKGTAKGTAKGLYVVVRTYSAGVHVGVLVSRRGTEVQLTDSRRIWSWEGANTLNEMALRGVGPASRVSEPVLRHEITEAIEVLYCTKEAEANLRGAKWST